MITFKQFIAEIDHDDTVYSKEASSYVVNFKIDSSYKPLMKIDDHEVLWKQNARGAFYVVVADGDKPALMLVLDSTTKKLPGGTLHGVWPDSLSSNEAFRGKGLALKLYKELVKNGQVLFSSHTQTTGSRRLWEQLVQSGVGEPFVMAEEAAARWYQNKYKQHESAVRVLLTGDFDQMNDEAYASEETCWVIVPHSMVGDLKKNAIKLGQKPVEEEKYVPEWEKPCWVVAINKTLGTPEAKIKQLARKAGWDGKSFGCAVHQTIQVAWDVIGKMPDLSMTKDAKGMTPKEFSGKYSKTGMVFTRKHVMPMVDGKLSNFNGHGDEEIVAVATYEKP